MENILISQVWQLDKDVFNVNLRSMLRSTSWNTDSPSTANVSMSISVPPPLEAPYAFRESSPHYHYPFPEYRPQSLAYAMTINPSEVNMSRAPPGFGLDSSMTSVAPLLSEKEVQVEDNPQDTEYEPQTPEEDIKPVLPLPNRANQPPRPPNAWILYRSERLRAIAAGEPIPGLLAVLEEQSLVRALDVSEQRNQGTKETSTSPEPNRFQLFKDAEPLTPPVDNDDKDDLSAEGGSKYRRALLQADISKVISMMWKRENRTVKSKYDAMAAAKKLEHQTKYPNYKYQPMRREEKIRHQEQLKAEKERVKKEAMAEKAQQRKLAKSAGQYRAAHEKSIAYAIKSPGENKKSRQRRNLPQSSHLLTIPLYPATVSQTPTDNIAQDPAAATPLLEYHHPVLEQPFHHDFIKQESHTPSRDEMPGDTFNGGMDFTPNYSGVGNQYLPLQPSPHPVYHLRPGGYILPPPQPGFIVQQDQVIPYTFEPIHFDQLYHPDLQHNLYPSSSTTLSNRNQPAVAVMTSAEYQHVGVSEAELAEMWAMLEDDSGIVAAEQNGKKAHARPTGNPIYGQMDEEEIENYSNLPAPADEQAHDGVPLPQLSSVVGSQIAMSWVGNRNEGRAPDDPQSPETTPTAQTIPQMPRSTQEEYDATLTPRAGAQKYSRFTSVAPIPINAAKAQAYQYRTGKESLLSVYKPLSPIDGMFTPTRSYPSALTQASYPSNDYRTTERRPSETYLQHSQSFPNEFMDQSGSYDYKFLTPRTAMFRDATYAPLSISAPSERWDGVAWQDSFVYQNRMEKYEKVDG